MYITIHHRMKTILTPYALHVCTFPSLPFPLTVITAGQGMLRLPSARYKAVWCDANTYGVAADKFGLEAAPCTACPNNMEAIKPASGPKAFFAYAAGATAGDGGFTDPKACLTKVGHGYDGRISYKCAPGWCNPGNNREACKQCPYGLTTSDIATQQASEANCGIAPGFGFHDNAIVPCPIGELLLLRPA